MPKSLIDGVLPASFESIKDKMAFEDSWLSGNFSSFNQWKKHARALFQASLLTPLAECEFNVEVLSTFEKEGVISQKIAFNISNEERVNAYFSFPSEGANHPALLLLHDHGAEFRIGKEKMLEPWDNDTLKEISDQWAEKYFSGIYPGNFLVKQGYAVLVVDVLGWNERGLIDINDQQALACNFFNLGRSLAGQVACDDWRSLQLLSTLPAVDPTRLGILGFSMGGFRAWQLSALSELAKATVVICWMATQQGLMVRGNNQLTGQAAYYMMHPGIVGRLDYADIAGISAPSPLLVFAGEEDELFSRSTVEGSFAKLQAIYQSQNAKEDLVTTLWADHGHVFYSDQQLAVANWLSIHLKANKS